MSLPPWVKAHSSTQIYLGSPWSWEGGPGVSSLGSEKQPYSEFWPDTVPFSPSRPSHRLCQYKAQQAVGG